MASRPGLQAVPRPTRFLCSYYDEHVITRPEHLCRPVFCVL